MSKEEPRHVRMSIMVKADVAETLRVKAFIEKTKPGPLAAKWLEERAAQTELPKEIKL